MKTCCEELLKNIESRKERELPDQLQDTLVMVGHGSNAGFLLRAGGRGYVLETCEDEVRLTLDNGINEDGDREWLSPDELEWLGQVGAALQVAVISCDSDIWTGFKKLTGLILPSKCIVQPKDAAETWENATRATIRRRTRIPAMKLDSVKALLLSEEECQKLASVVLSAMDIGHLTRGLNTRVSAIEHKSSVFGAPMGEHNIRVMCWPASYGDTYSLTIKFNDDTRCHIIIDGGLAKEFNKFAWPHIRSLYAAKGEINASLLTHVDMDHISGLLAWAKFNRDQTGKRSPISIRAGIHIVNAPAKTLYPGARGINQLVDLINIYRGNVGDIYRAYRGGVLQVDQDHRSILSEAPALHDWQSKGLEVYIVHPTAEHVAEHYDKHKGALLEKKDGHVTIANIIGIVPLFQYNGHRLLFCGDARAKEIVSGLEECDLLPRQGNPQDHHISQTNPLTLLTLPHHGSQNNSTEEIFSSLACTCVYHQQ